MGSSIRRSGRIIIRDKVAQMAVFLLTDWCFQRNRLLCNSHDFANLIDRHIKLCTDLFCGRFPAIRMQKLTGNFFHFINCLDHMNWNPNGTRLIGNGAGNGLTNPPCSISGKFKAFCVIEFFNCFNQAQIPFLNQIKELHSTTQISLCDTDNQTKVCFRQTFFGCFISIGNPDRQVNLLFRRKQRNTPNLFQVYLNRVIDRNTFAPNSGINVVTLRRKT